MNIPPVIYAIEAFLLRILVRPILNTVERFTGFSNLECAIYLSLFHLMLTTLAAFLAFSNVNISLNGESLLLVRILILPIITLSLYYSGYLVLVTLARLDNFLAEKDDTERAQKSKIIRDPKRLGWYAGLTVCIAVMCDHTEFPFVIHLLIPFCGFAPILVLCGIRPYYDASEAEQRKRKVREMTTFATLALVLMCLATLSIYKGNYQSKLLLIGAYITIYVLIYKVIRRKEV